jgi:hypothetical protein
VKPLLVGVHRGVHRSGNPPTLRAFWFIEMEVSG